MHSTDLRQAVTSQSVQQNLKLSVFQFLHRKWLKVFLYPIRHLCELFPSLVLKVSEVMHKGCFV